VMPKLRDLWPQWKDDQRWWIKPLANRVRPEQSPPQGNRPSQHGGKGRAHGSGSAAKVKDGVAQ
jgi:hypothetical protein